MAVTPELLVQVAHLPMRHGDDVLQWRAVILQAWMLNHVRCAATGRVELILVQGSGARSV